MCYTSLDLYNRSVIFFLISMDIILKDRASYKVRIMNNEKCYTFWVFISVINVSHRNILIDKMRIIRFNFFFCVFFFYVLRDARSWAIMAFLSFRSRIALNDMRHLLSLLIHVLPYIYSRFRVIILCFPLSLLSSFNCESVKFCKPFSSSGLQI